MFSGDGWEKEEKEGLCDICHVYCIVCIGV